MIPKTIHFIWLGSEIPDWANYNINTFRIHNPDYQIVIHTDASMLKPEYRTNYDRCVANSSQQCDLLRFSILQQIPGWYFDCDCRAFGSIDNIPLVEDNRLVCPNYGEYPGTTMVSSWMLGCTAYTDFAKINEYIVGWDKRISYLTFSNPMLESMYFDLQTVSWEITNSGYLCREDATRNPKTIIGHCFKGE